MGIINYSVATRNFKAKTETTCEEIHFAQNHGKAWTFGEQADRWEANYERGCDRTRGREVLFVDYENKSDLAKWWHTDAETRRRRFGTEDIPVFRTAGDGTGWGEEYDCSEPVGFLFPEKTDPNARTAWIFYPRQGEES